MTGAGDGTHALLVLGFESAGREVEQPMAEALDICAEHGGSWERRVMGGAGTQPGAGDADAVGSWREAFLRAPYLRDTFVATGVLCETFETAITWERFPAFHEAVLARATVAVRQHCGGAGSVTSRFTHVYPDGPAPYYTILAPARRGDELEQWAAIKRACSDAVIEHGGTITHHHAVGRDHRPWYDYSVRIPSRPRYAARRPPLTRPARSTLAYSSILPRGVSDYAAKTTRNPTRPPPGAPRNQLADHVTASVVCSNGGTKQR
jgi:alkyldihydroxyacetonephosphate synthase